MQNLYKYERHYRVHSNVHNVNVACVNQGCSKHFKTFNALRVLVSRSHVGDDVASVSSGQEFRCPHIFRDVKFSFFFLKRLGTLRSIFLLVLPLPVVL